MHFASYLMKYFNFVLFRWIPSGKNWRSLQRKVSRNSEVGLGPLLNRVAVLGSLVSAFSLAVSGALL